MDSNYRCGFHFWHPAWVQQFGNQKTFIFVYGFLGTIQAMATIYFVITMTTIEKRFQISGSIMGVILCGNELSQILLSMILAYIGGQRNRPRWISWGVFCSAISCFILALPHFLYGAGDEALQLTKEYQGTLNSELINPVEMTSLFKRNHNLCSMEILNTDDCSSSDPYLIPMILIFVSQFVMGIGNSLLYSLGQSYLDDNAKKTSTPLLLGFALSLKTLGPVFGFILGYTSLQMYIDPGMTPTISKTDTRWLGAWWFGWIVLGAILCIFSLLIGMFPKQLKIKGNKIHETEKVHHMGLSEFLPAFKRLIKNKLLVFNAFSSFFYLLGSNCYLVFLSKYIEVQFHKSRSNATIVTGPVTLIGMTTGFIASGYIISKYKPAARHVLLWNVLVGVLYLSKQFLNLTLSCSDDISKYLTKTNVTEIKSLCNYECHCDATPFTPICNPIEMRTYFSPCHAGCTDWNDDLKVFSNCSCITLKSHDEMDTNLMPGTCFEDCAIAFWTFTLFSAFVNCLVSSGRIGNTLVDFRCITKKDKSFAQGFVQMVISVANLIGPIIFAVIIDTTCLVWTDTCENKGSCQLYDQKRFRYLFNYVALSFTLIAVLFDILVWYHGKKLNMYGEDEIQKQETNIY